MERGVVEVTNCFCVPHKETDDHVEAEISYATDLYDLNRRVNPSENIVGELSLYLYDFEVRKLAGYRFFW